MSKGVQRQASNSLASLIGLIILAAVITLPIVGLLAYFYRNIDFSIIMVVYFGAFVAVLLIRLSYLGRPRAQHGTANLMSMPRLFSSVFLFALGLTLMVDSFFLHSISFNYSLFGLGWLDPYLNHWMWGVVALVLAFLLVTPFTSSGNRKSVMR